MTALGVRVDQPTAGHQPHAAQIFDEMLWRDDQLLLRGLVFDLESRERGARDRFSFAKPRRMMDQYAAFWRSRPTFSPAHVLELGMWDGGSLAMLYEQFRPRRLLGIDLEQREDSEYLRRYAESVPGASITTIWGVNQADTDRLSQIARDHFNGVLDLVVDDASHHYSATKASFETLFPLLSPGGLYIIEDWSWSLWPNLRESPHFYPRGSELPRLIFELTEATGSMKPYLKGAGHAMTVKPFISNLQIYPDFVVLERGPATVAAGTSLEKLITRSEQWQRVLDYPPLGEPPLIRQVWWKMAAYARRALRH